MSLRGMKNRMAMIRSYQAAHPAEYAARQADALQVGEALGHECLRLALRRVFPLRGPHLPEHTRLYGNVIPLDEPVRAAAREARARIRAFDEAEAIADVTQGAWDNSPVQHAVRGHLQAIGHGRALNIIRHYPLAEKMPALLHNNIPQLRAEATGILTDKTLPPAASALTRLEGWRKKSLLTSNERD